jgi:hypothetical protein
MKRNHFYLSNRVLHGPLAGLLAAGLLLAQDTSAPQPPVAQSDAQQQTNGGGWKRVGDQWQVYVPASPGADAQDPNEPPPSNYPPNSYPPSSQAPRSNYPNANQPPYYPSQNQPPQNQQQNYPPPPPVPAQLTIPAGTYVTMRINQMLSSDKNQPGDAFTGSLTQPIVVNGVVVAEPGQTVGGRVVTAERHHLDKPARLGLALTNLTLVDGQQLSIVTQFVSRTGGTTPAGAEVGTVAATSAIGATIGAIAGWGTGAAIGAGAGAAAGLIGVLVTHNHASVIYPEQVLTFKIEAPVTFSTGNSSQVFRYVQPNEYDRPNYSNPPPQNGSYENAPPPPAYGAYAYANPYPYAYPYPYYGWGYPYYWGPTFAFYGGYWWGGHYYPYHGYWGGHYYYGPHGYAGGTYHASVGGVHAAVGGSHGGGGHR